MHLERKNWRDVVIRRVGKACVKKRAPAQKPSLSCSHTEQSILAFVRSEIWSCCCSATCFLIFPAGGLFERRCPKKSKLLSIEARGHQILNFLPYPYPSISSIALLGAPRAIIIPSFLSLRSRFFLLFPRTARRVLVVFAIVKESLFWLQRGRAPKFP